MHKIVQAAVQTVPFVQLQKELKLKGNTVYLNELVGGALSFYLAAAVTKTAGLHILVAEDRDAAAPWYRLPCNFYLRSFNGRFNVPSS